MSAMPRPRKKQGRRAGAGKDSEGRRSGEVPSLQFSGINAILAASGLLSLVLGYWALSTGSITLAPLLLVLGYVVLLPLAMFR